MPQVNEPKVPLRVDLSPAIFRALHREAQRQKVTKRSIVEGALSTVLNLPVKDGVAA